MSVSVMITDDHVLMREGIRKLLEYGGDIEVVAEAGDGKECLDKLEKCKPQVLLLDINMPTMNGLEVLEKIRERQIDVKVLILTVHNDVEYLLKAIDIGVDGYILKESESSELRKAIFLVAKGENYIQPKMIPMLNCRLMARDTDQDKVESLTKRELEVLVKLAEGMINKEIAHILNISERTVKNHVSNIFRKIDVSDRTQAAVFAIKNDLVKLF